MRPGGDRIISFIDLLFLFLFFFCVLFDAYRLPFDHAECERISIFWDIFQGAGVLQYHPGALVEAGFQWILIGSNDLHRFWDHCYVGHAVNIKNDRGSS
jgi:hypothetical protein